MSSSPARLNKVEKTRFEKWCIKICPYIIVACIIILCVLFSIALVKYGHFLSTPENTYEHLSEIVT